MSATDPGFEPHYRRLVSAEQRIAILKTIGETLDGASTIGEIIDASVTLGFTQGIGELRLVDLADVLLRDPTTTPANGFAIKAPPGDKQAAAKTATAPEAAAEPKAPTAEAFDERMSLDEAVAAFVPLVRSLGEATMQHLEEATGLGRRKLRFHVGQLVKHGHLTRHGMGRGTYYTA